MNPPDKIYLQWHGSGDPEDGGPVDTADVTWCVDEIYTHDIPYVRALPEPKEWLKAETEADHGPMETWPEEVKDKFYRDLGFLHHFVTSNQKEVMPVKDDPQIHRPVLKSPANVQTGGGATPEQVEIVKRIALNMKRKAECFKEDLSLAGDVISRCDARDGYELNQSRANALEAILAEREDLLKDKARLDWLDKHQCGFDHIKWGEYQHYSYPENKDGMMQARAVIDAAMKGEG